MGSVLFTVSFVALVLTIRNKVTQPSLSPYVVTIVGNDEGGYAFLYRSKIQDEVGKQPSIELIHKEDFHRSWAKFKGTRKKKKSLFFMLVFHHEMISFDSSFLLVTTDIFNPPPFFCRPFS